MATRTTEQMREYMRTRRRIAQNYVNEVRAATVCERCGKQPVQFHHDDHLLQPNHRVSALVGSGASIKRLKKEIDKCQALCNRCHMEIDGRLEAATRALNSYNGRLNRS